MSTPILTSIIALFIIAFLSFCIAKHIFRYRKSDRIAVSFAFAWFSVGITMTLMGVRNAFFAFGFSKVDKFIAYAVQFFLPVIFASLGYFIFLAVLGKKKIRIVLNILILVCSGLFLFYLLKEGIRGPVISDWGSEYSAPSSANFFMMVLAAAAFPFLLYGVFEGAIKWIKKKSPLPSEKFLSILSVLIFIIGAAFEQLGNVGWHIFFVRIIIIASALLAYLSYYKPGENIC
ncbi:hypothetical protein J7J23_00810 [bacterium]|nr:hypothetical protein [bacterium]